MKRLVVEIAAAVVFFAGGWMAHERIRATAAPVTNTLAQRLSAAQLVCDYVMTGEPAEWMFHGRDYCVRQMLDHGDVDRCMGARVDSEECVKAALLALAPRSTRAPAARAAAKRTKPAGSQSPSGPGPSAR